MSISKKLGIFAALLIGLGLVVYGPSELHRGVPLLPPLIAIGLAIITREVIASLFLGIFAGSVAVVGFDGFASVPSTLFKGLLRSVDTYVLGGLTDSSHAAIVVFSLSIGGMVGVVARSGGLQGIVDAVSRKADNPVWSQLSAYFMGLIIFFDDYANTLLVGNTLRPLTDRARVSREKLSFVVDATAAPVASVAALSSWIGYELGLIGDAFKSSGIRTDAYLAFLESIPYRFYALFLLIFIPAGILMGREFGPMLRAERRARGTGQVLKPGSQPLAGEDLDQLKAPEGKPLRWVNAAVPILTLILTTLFGLIYSGRQAIAVAEGAVAAQDASFRAILGAADSTTVLLWAALLSSVVAIGMVVGQRILSFDDAMRAWVTGVRSMVLAMIILSLAWALGSVAKEIGTDRAVVDLVIHNLPASLLPAVIFVAGAAISFATGTAWGTMAILFPVGIPVAVQLTGGDPAAIDPAYLAATVGAILTGAIFGDHCSPISDTTVMSSMASAVDHVDHVTTQMPYAFAVGGIALLVGYVPSGIGFNPWVSNALGFLLVIGLLRFIGRKVEEN